MIVTYFTTATMAFVM